MYHGQPLNPVASIFSLGFELGIIICQLYVWCVFIYVVLNWLFALDFLQRHKRIFASKPHTWGGFEGFFRRLVEPILMKIRKKVPRFGQLDLSPIVLLLAIMFVMNLLNYIRQHVVAILS